MFLSQAPGTPVGDVRKLLKAGQAQWSYVRMARRWRHAVQADVCHEPH